MHVTSGDVLNFFFVNIEHVTQYQTYAMHFFSDVKRTKLQMHKGIEQVNKKKSAICNINCTSRCLSRQ